MKIPMVSLLFLVSCSSLQTNDSGSCTPLVGNWPLPQSITLDLYANGTFIQYQVGVSVTDSPSGSWSFVQTESPYVGFLTLHFAPALNIMGNEVTDSTYSLVEKNDCSSLSVVEVGN